MGGSASVVGTKAVVAMVVAQAMFSATNVLCKLALNDGMNARILATYRYLFAAVFLCPLAFFLERKNRPRITWKELMLAFLTGLFGGSLFQNLYLYCIQIVSITFITAMLNLVPAITFILAIVFRLEKLEIGTVSGLAKIAGTLVGIGGAMLLTFYRGPSINLWPTHIHLLHSVGEAHRHNGSGSQVVGSLFVVISCLSYSIWLIIQAKVSRKYPYQYTNTSLLCLMAAIQSTAFALCSKRDLESWRIGFDIRLLTAAFSGVGTSGLILLVLDWCIRKKGPLFVSAFNPVILVMVALLGSLLFDEKLYLGSVLGSVLIVLGLYLVLWGKGKEKAMVSELPA